MSSPSQHYICDVNREDSSGGVMNHSPRLRLTFPPPTPHRPDGPGEVSLCGAQASRLVAAAGGGNRTARSSRSSTGRGGRGTAAHDGSAAVVLALLELAHPVTQREALLALAARIAARGRLTAARNRSGTARSTGSGSTSGRGGTGRSTSGRSGAARGGSGTGRGRSTAARSRGAAAAIIPLRTGVNAVQASETHQRGGNPCELHSKSPSFPSG